MTTAGEFCHQAQNIRSHFLILRNIFFPICDDDFDPNKSLIVNEPLARASIGEQSFVGEIARLGHGLQRAFLVAILQELASSEVAGGPTLLLGFEEPELYQHPPQAQHMAAELEELATEEKNSQVIVTTHSPYFVSTKGFENVRMIRKNRATNDSRCTSTTYDQIASRLSGATKEKTISTATMTAIEQIMQPSQRELYFTKVAILVEGMEDVAFIGSHFQVSEKWSTFRRLGCHFVLAVGKTNLSRPLAIANELSIPAFVIFDGDGNKKDLKPHIRDNSCILRLCGIDEFDAIPTEIRWGENHVVWPTCIFDAVQSEITKKVWEDAEHAVRRAKGYVEGVKQKNNMLIAGVIDELNSNGVRSKVLDRLCENILDFAKSVDD